LLQISHIRPFIYKEIVIEKTVRLGVVKKFSTGGKLNKDDFSFTVYYLPFTINALWDLQN